jgi:hypothetical protein
MKEKDRMMPKEMTTFLLMFLFATGALAAEERGITVTLTVPDAAWEIVIDEVHEVKGEIWVVSTVSREPDMMGAQVISTVKDSVKCAAADLPEKHFVIGKTWNWPSEEPITFIKTMSELEKELKSGKLLCKGTKREP